MLSLEKQSAARRKTGRTSLKKLTVILGRVDQSTCMSTTSRVVHGATDSRVLFSASLMERRRHKDDVMVGSAWENGGCCHMTPGHATFALLSDASHATACAWCPRILLFPSRFLLHLSPVNAMNAIIIVSALVALASARVVVSPP